MSHVYPLAKQKFMTGALNLGSDTIKVVFLSASYTYNAAHEFYSDLTGIIGTASAALTAKTENGGVFDAADLLFPSVPAGSTITQIAGYKDTGSAGTSPLIWIHQGLSQATNGGDIAVQWNASGIFAL